MQIKNSVGPPARPSEEGPGLRVNLGTLCCRHTCQHTSWTGGPHAFSLAAGSPSPPTTWNSRSTSGPTLDTRAAGKPLPAWPTSHTSGSPALRSVSYAAMPAHCWRPASACHDYGHEGGFPPPPGEVTASARQSRYWTLGPLWGRKSASAPAKRGWGPRSGSNVKVPNWGIL